MASSPSPSPKQATPARKPVLVLQTKPRGIDPLMKELIVNLIAPTIAKDILQGRYKAD